VIAVSHNQDNLASTLTKVERVGDNTRSMVEEGWNVNLLSRSKKVDGIRYSLLEGKSDEIGGTWVDTWLNKGEAVFNDGTEVEGSVTVGAGGRQECLDLSIQWNVVEVGEDNNIPNGEFVSCGNNTEANWQISVTGGDVDLSKSRVDWVGWDLGDAAVDSVGESVAPVVALAESWANSVTRLALSSLNTPAALWLISAGLAIQVGAQGFRVAASSTLNLDAIGDLGFGDANNIKFSLGRSRSTTNDDLRWPLRVITDQANGDTIIISFRWRADLRGWDLQVAEDSTSDLRTSVLHVEANSLLPDDHILLREVIRALHQANTSSSSSHKIDTSNVASITDWEIELNSVVEVANAITVVRNEPEVVLDIRSASIVVVLGLSQVDEEGIWELVISWPLEVGIVGRVQFLGEGWGMWEILVVGEELEWLQVELVGNSEASVGGWLRAVWASPAIIARAGQVLVALTTEVARSWAVRASLWDLVVSIHGSQQLLSSAVWGWDSGWILSDAKLSNAADVTSIIAVSSPERVASSAELVNVRLWDTLAWIRLVDRDASLWLWWLNGWNLVFNTPWEGLAFNHLTPVIHSPLTSFINVLVTAAAWVASLPWLAVPVLLTADLWTDPPAPAVHEWVVAVEGRWWASQNWRKTQWIVSSDDVTHRLRERWVLEEVLEALGADEFAGSLLAFRAGQSVLIAQESTSLSDVEPAHLWNLDDELFLRDGEGRAVAKEARATG